MYKKVNDKKLTEYLFSRGSLSFTYNDIQDKKGNIIRRFVDRKTNELLGIIINWKKYFIIIPD